MLSTNGFVAASGRRGIGTGERFVRSGGVSKVRGSRFRDGLFVLRFSRTAVRQTTALMETLRRRTGRVWGVVEGKRKPSVLPTFFVIYRPKSNL